MTLYCTDTYLDGQCGGKLLHNFTDYDSYGDLNTLATIRKKWKGYMLVATFNQHQEKEYLECCKTFTLLGQSKPIKNPNTDNKIFTAVFKA